MLALALLLGGCSSSDSSTAGVDMASAGAADEAMAESGVDAEGGGTALTADTDRQVVITGQVAVTVDDPIAAASEVVRLVESTGGHIQERYQTAAREGRSASASIVARIPADGVTSALERLADIGEVVDSSLSSTEVTAQARDLDARIRALQISITRLEDLLTRSGTVADIVAAEQVLTDRQSQLEQLQSQRAALAEQVALSTITINLYPDGSVPADPPSGFMSGLTSGWNALVATGSALLTFVGVLLPWLAVAGLLTAVVVPVARRLRRRSAAKAPRSVSTPSTAAQAQAVRPGDVLPPAQPGPPVPPAPPSVPPADQPGKPPSTTP